MSKLKIKLNKYGPRELRTSPEMMELIKERASQAAQRAGEGYGTSPYQGPNRVNVAVFTETEKAMRDNNQNNTLLKSLR